MPTRRGSSSGQTLVLARCFGFCLGIAYWVLSGLFAPTVHAYCRTTTCAECPRDPQGCLMGGEPLSWPGRCVAVGVQANASRMADYETVERMLAHAFETWNAVRCRPDGLPPSIELRMLDQPVLCGRSEYLSDAANANVLVFRDDQWPYAGAGSELASTTVRSNTVGAILDADIEVNALRPLLLDGDQGPGFITGAHDLQSIITHEVGHLLGLDHSSDPDSIMQVRLPPRIVRTTLGDDDIAAICAAYPPEREAPCDPTPEQEFSPYCALDPATGGACNAARPATVQWPSPLLLMLTVLGALARRRRRSTSRLAREAHASTAGGTDGRG